MLSSHLECCGTEDVVSICVFHSALQLRKETTASMFVISRSPVQIRLSGPAVAAFGVVGQVRVRLDADGESSVVCGRASQGASVVFL